MHAKVLGTELPTVEALAYLGDARHALYVRRMLVARGICRAGELNAEALRYVTAPAQAEAAARILPLLTEDEEQVYRRGCNTSHINRPKNVPGAVYRSSTGFEAVLGMLSWLGDEERAEELMDAAYREVSAKDTGKDDKNDTQN